LEEYFKKKPKEYETFEKTRLETVVAELGAIPEYLQCQGWIDFKVSQLGIDEQLGMSAEESAEEEDFLDKVQQEIRGRDKKNLIKNIIVKYETEEGVFDNIRIFSEKGEYHCSKPKEENGSLWECSVLKRDGMPVRFPPRRGEKELRPQEKKFIDSLFEKFDLF
jgi:hypothetical protein